MLPDLADPHDIKKRDCDISYAGHPSEMRSLGIESINLLLLWPDAGGGRAEGRQPQPLEHDLGRARGVAALGRPARAGGTTRPHGRCCGRGSCGARCVAALCFLLVDACSLRRFRNTCIQHGSPMGSTKGSRTCPRY